jgi:hypothetical protein
MLMNWQRLQLNPNLWLTPAEYLWVWFKEMTGSIVGIKSHLPMMKSGGYLLPVYLVMALSVAGFALRWRPRQQGWLPVDLLAIVVIYAAYLIHEVNYDSYLWYGEPGITLYGRYLLLVIVPAYAMGAHYLLQLFSDRRVRVGLAVACALLFITYDFPWFLAHATPEWYGWLAR